MVMPTRIRERANRRTRDIFLCLLSVCERLCVANSSPLKWHARQKDNGNGKANQYQIRYYIACAHGNQLGHALPTLWFCVGNHLPIAIERLTLGQSRNNNSNKRDHEKPSNELHTYFVRPLPYLTCQTLEKFQDGELSDPKTK